jgi:hypothetical protein
MKQVTFLLVDGVLKPSCLFGAIEVFEKANEFYVNKGQRPFYDIQLAGMNKGNLVVNDLPQVQLAPFLCFTLFKLSNC